MKRISNRKFTMIMLAGLIFTIAASPAPALPPDPDNAALLYYQGFLSLPQLSQEARSHLGDVARGKITPDEQVRQDIDKSAGAIHFAGGIQIQPNPIGRLAEHVFVEQSNTDK